jgi:hypothetical protein
MNSWALRIGMLCVLSLASLQAAQPCSACHPDFAAQLGAGHPKVKATSIASCLPCHDPARKAALAPAKNAFSARIHAAHGKDGTGVACGDCHTSDARGFSVRGAKKPLGKVAADDLKATKAGMADVCGADHLAAGHAKAGVSCGGCHATRLPGRGDAVENQRCLDCHGPMEALVEKTRPKDAHLPNPHQSHYGTIACTACHLGHQPSVVMCKDCHPKFNMNISHGK